MSESERQPIVTRRTRTRIPTPRGEFQLCLYDGSPDGKEHLALVMGEVEGQDGVLVRVHSECFTGDVLGSLRCDCGSQLDRAMRLVAQRGQGIIVYLRQEGRGIGLLDKLRAYNLQDQGYDTVDANLALGHQADERDYAVAAAILCDLQVGSIRILTNNPLKVAALRELGTRVERRIPLQVAVGPENRAYLATKARRMNHLLSFSGPALDGLASGLNGPEAEGDDVAAALPEVKLGGERGARRPSVTLSYAQSLDGSIAARPGEPLRLSGDRAMRMTHRLRAGHDAILVGIGTVLADDPRLTVRLVAGPDPRPVVVDGNLRLPLTANLFSHGHRAPWVVTTERADPARARLLERAGASVIRVPSGSSGRVDLGAMLDRLAERGVESVMVEGGSRIINSFLTERLVDQFVLTIVPRLVGGLRALNGHGEAGGLHYPRLTDVHYQWLEGDLVIWGRPVWEAP